MTAVGTLRAFRRPVPEAGGVRILKDAVNTPLKSRQEPRLPNPELGFIRPGDPAILERDDFSSNHHPALSFCLSMIFSENRYPLFPDHALDRIVVADRRHVCDAL